MILEAWLTLVIRAATLLRQVAFVAVQDRW